MDEHFKRGRELFLNNQYDKAIIEFKKSLEISTRFFLPYEQLGICYSEKGQYEEAVKYYELAIQDAPPAFDITMLYFNKALALKKLGKYEEAILDLKKVLEQNPMESNAWTLKSNCHRAIREYEEAVKCLDKALEIDPKNLLARKNQATLLSIQGDEKKAQEILSENLSIDPIDFQSWSIKGEQLMELGNFGEAMNCFNVAVNLSSGHPYTHQLSEKCKQNQKHYQEIRKSLPQNSMDWNDRGGKLYSIGVYIEALGCFEEALRLEPGRYEFLMNKAGTLERLGRYKKALLFMEYAIRKKPNDANLWNLKGNIWFKKEQFKNAFDCYEKALELNPNFRVAQKNKDAALKRLR
jgi:tetratricopeptide (TPR) repeat protein